MERPKLRGVLHQHAAPCALGAGLVLAVMAPTWRAGAAASIYAGSLVLLFTVSALYHRITWTEGPRSWWRRADHAAIFVLIAGTYTPVALLGVKGYEGDRLLMFVWIGAGVGILKSLFWPKSPKWITAALAVAVGWTLAPYLGDAGRALGGGKLTVVLIGGVAYTLGALAYAFRRPNPWPGVFGHHEVMHAGTLVGAACHFAVVVALVRAS